jgi:phenylalanyl-tRNA synthetase alpha chain
MAVSRQELESALQELSKALEGFLSSGAPTAESLEAFRVAYVGRSGKVTERLKQLKDLSVDDKREMGPKLQQLKAEFDAAISGKQRALEADSDAKSLADAGIDLTLPAFPSTRGRVHPLTQVLDEMGRILGLMGFSWAEGPHAETDYHNFTALNIPEHHPARDMHDTFYLKDFPLVLRTHTSPVQIRSMESQKPPLRILCPGRVFRHEAVDATHSAVFHQVEGLAVDKDISFADLKGTLSDFMKRLLGSDTKIRFRPSYFPFTEPSTEVDVTCFFCKAKGCPVCKHTGWIELLGAGVVNPNVLKAVGYDPEQWSGFAFGIGVERIAMLRLGVKDIRLFYENDQRFLEQFDESLA